MASPNIYNFTTGPSPLPDIGKLSYNGCVFSPLYETKVSGKVVKDNANRTTKFMEYTLSVDGYVTLPDGNEDINLTTTTMATLISSHGGVLIYTGRGFDLVINAGGAGAAPVLGSVSDVAWGPVPELLEFQPLGAGRSAKVQWKCVVRIPEIKDAKLGILQLNYETIVSYAEDGYSTLSIRGTLEIPLTRQSQINRNVTRTVDEHRSILEKRILNGIDLRRFRITRREFNISRDKRTLEWDIVAEERPYMDPPPLCTLARGNYNVRPTKVGLGLVLWLCTLKATYTVRSGARKREAWLAFLALLRLRMRASRFGNQVAVGDPQIPKVPKTVFSLFNFGGIPVPIPNPYFDTDNHYGSALGAAIAGGIENESRLVWLLDFSIDEGLYLDSKTITFSATWRLNTTFSHILLASGIWRKVVEEDNKGNNLWAASVSNISGTKSWLPNELDPKLDIIVDFGGPENY